MRLPAGILAIAVAIGMAIPAIAADDTSVKKQKHSAQPEITSTVKDNKETPLTTLDEGIAAPYHPCINARGWANGRLVCAD